MENCHFRCSKWQPFACGRGNGGFWWPPFGGCEGNGGFTVAAIFKGHVKMAAMAAIQRWQKEMAATRGWVGRHSKKIKTNGGKGPPILKGKNGGIKDKGSVKGIKRKSVNFERDTRERGGKRRADGSNGGRTEERVDGGRKEERLRGCRKRRSHGRHAGERYSTEAAAGAGGRKGMNFPP